MPALRRLLYGATVEVRFDATRPWRSATFMRTSHHRPSNATGALVRLGRNLVVLARENVRVPGATP